MHGGAGRLETVRSCVIFVWTSLQAPCYACPGNAGSAVIFEDQHIMYFWKNMARAILPVLVVVGFSASAVLAASIDFGDNSSEWSYDGECDDPRFAGRGMAEVLLDEDLGRDAADCKSLYDQGLIYLLKGSSRAGIDFGDNSSEWSYDGECDDPRFGGRGMAEVLLDEDLGRDAADCRALYQAGSIYLR